MSVKKMAKCVCGGSLKDDSLMKNGVKLSVQKCIKCGEIYIPGSEMMRYDIIKGTSPMVRKIRKSGDSLIITVPKQIVEKFNAHDGDYITFEPNEKEVRIKIIHAE